MSLNKDEISELNSLVDRIVQTEKALLLADLAAKKSHGDLLSFLHYQQYPEQKSNK